MKIIHAFIKLFFIGLCFYNLITNLKNDNLIRASFDFVGLIVWIILLTILIYENIRNK